MIKTWNISWAGHVACVVKEEHKHYGILVEDLKESDHSVDASSKFEDSIKNDFKDVGSEIVD